MKGDDIAERLIEFGVKVIKISEAMPRTYSNRHICTQIIRSGTSAGANYEEARGAESQKDFTHKLGICLKELRETRYWLKIVKKLEVHLPDLDKIMKESDELCRIIGKSILTAKNKATIKK